MDGNRNSRRFDALRADTEAIRDFFNGVGPSFYTWFFTLMGYRSSLKYFWRRHCDRIEFREGMKILDAGIGTLRFPWYLKTVDATIMALLGEKPQLGKEM